MPVGKAPDMEKKAILIRNGASFMVNAVQKNLEGAGYEVLPVNASVAAVNEKRAEALFRLRQPRQKVDLPVQKHLVKIGKTAVDILVSSRSTAYIIFCKNAVCQFFSLWNH